MDFKKVTERVFPQTRQAFASGDVGYQHVALLARTAEKVGAAAVQGEGKCAMIFKPASARFHRLGLFLISARRSRDKVIVNIIDRLEIRFNRRSDEWSVHRRIMKQLVYSW